MMDLEPPKGLKDWWRLYRLYISAFPASERKPFSIIGKMYREGKGQVLCIRERGRFCGMITTILSRDLILVDYFAMEEKSRGRGLGTAALKAYLETCSEVGVFLEIESTRQACPGAEDREKRKRFYIRCGLEPMEVFAEVFGVPMELMGRNCKLDFDGYCRFYRDRYSPWAAEHIRRLPQDG